MKCAFCEEPLVCKACRQPFRPRRVETHLAVYQPEMAIFCPECGKPLVCKACGYLYGADEEDEEEV